MHVAAIGKLNGWGVVSAIHPGELVYVRDDLTGASFLVDTGSTYCILPHSSPSPPTGPRLRTANGVQIPCWGVKKLPIVFSGRRYVWNFLLAAVNFKILGNDFLRHFRLLVDVANNRLLDGTTWAAIPTSPPPFEGACAVAVSPLGTAPGSSPPSVGPAPPSLPPPGLNCAEKALLASFKDVLNAEGRLPPSSHGVVHHIVTEGRPISAKFRRLDEAKLAAAKAEFQHLEAEGIVRRSDSSWASPLHMVQKPDGSWRPCGDYRRLNLVTEADCYPLPNMADITASLAGSTCFSKLDLKKGYHQIPVNEDDIKKTALITPFGLFEFVRMPFGLKNAGMTFQRFMDRVLTGLPYVLIYMDDILVASPDRISHVGHLRAVLERLRDNGLVLNSSKCLFFRQSVEFLGQHVSAAGVAPLAQHVEAIRLFPLPVTVKDLQGFLGAVNFYRKFISSAAKILLPLTDALKGGKSGTEALSWSGEMLAAFSAVKTALLTATCLVYPRTDSKLSLATDASATHVGAVLQQWCVKRAAWQPLGFFSSKLDKAQLSYSAFDRELFAIFAGIRHFLHQLEGRTFQIWTDHKPLTFALARATDSWTARQQRHFSFIAEYTRDIVHVPGKENVVADLLSRPPATACLPATGGHPDLSPGSAAISLSGAISRRPGIQSTYVCSGSGPGPSSPSPSHVAPVCATPSCPAGPGVPIDLRAISEDQLTCTSSQQLLHSPSLQFRQLTVGTFKLWYEMSTGHSRLLVPDTWKRPIFNSVHQLAHPGTRACRRLLSTRYVWHGMARDVTAWCRDCLTCQRGKVTRQPPAPVQPIPVPSRRFSHIHVDLVGPLPVSSSGFRHVLTVIDRSTRWTEVIPLTSTDATSCANALVAG
jgi:hypothetical protein